jgi:hydrogenase maturation protease
VARRLTGRPQPEGVTVVDFGIRGIDLTYALMDGYDAVILVDAAARGHAPGAVTVVEPTAPDPRELDPGDIMISGHDLDPAKVLKVVAALGGQCGRIVLVACEPFELGGDDGAMGLSPPVAAAIDPAVATVEDLIGEFLKLQTVIEAHDEKEKRYERI